MSTLTAPQLERSLRSRVARDPLARCVRDVARSLAIDVWLVGGFVRDAALGRRSNDVDLAGGSGTLRLVRRLETAWGRRGFRFRKRGVTTWRFHVDGRTVDLVDASRRGLQQELRRRELTINAIAFELDRSRLLDPLAGLADLRAGRLRLPQPGVMRADPIRAVRAARFLAQLPGCRLDRAARREATAVAPRLSRASVERVREELDKLLIAAAPQRGLSALRELELLDRILPELQPLGSCVAGQDRPDVWTHTVEAIAVSARAWRLPAGGIVRDPESRSLLRWSLLLHDISKPETFSRRADGRPAFHGHEVLGARRADALLRRLRKPRRDRARIRRLVLYHLRPGHLADAGAPARGLRRLVREAAEDLPLLVLHAACDARASVSADDGVRWRRLRRVADRLLELAADAERTSAAPLIDGRTLMRSLGIDSGPRVGTLLRRIREHQEDGLVRDRREALALARRLTEDER